jgi:hypothetical protein
MDPTMVDAFEAKASFEPHRHNVHREVRFGLAFLCALCVVVVPFSYSRAASPRDELLALVPDDVGFCLVLEGLREHGKALADSPFVKQVAHSPLGAKILKSDQTEKLNAVDQLLRNYLDLSADQLRDEILGDAIVLAYRPGPPGKPEQEQGLFLLHARNAKLLGLTIERLNALQKDTGSLSKIEPQSIAGRTYYRRIESGRVNCYYQSGPILAVTSQESFLRELLERVGGDTSGRELPLVRRFRELGADGSVATLWINPRAFDSGLDQKVAQAKGSQATALRTLLRYWKSLRGLAVSLALDTDLRLSLAIAADTDQLPPGARRLFAAMSAGELWNAFPKDAILTVAGQIDVPALIDLLNDFLDDESRKPVRTAVDQSIAAILGPEAVKPLIAALGPDWGLSIAAPARSNSDWFPRVLVAIRVRSGASDPPAAVVLTDALNYLAAVVVFAQNGGHAGPWALRVTVQDRVVVRYLVSEEKFPKGCQPAFALKDGYLLVASSPDLIREFHFERRTPPPAKDGSNIPLFRFSVTQTQSYLRECREPLVQYITHKNQTAGGAASALMDGLLAVAQFLDRVELTRRAEPGRMILTLRVQTSEPLK